MSGVTEAPNHELPARRDPLLSMIEIGKALTSCLEARNVLETLMKEVERLIEPEAWSLLLVEDSGELVFEIAVSSVADRLHALWVTAVATGLRRDPQASFVGSIVAASTVRTANLKLVDSDNHGAPMGLALQSLRSILFTDETGRHVVRRASDVAAINFTGDLEVNFIV